MATENSTFFTQRLLIEAYRWRGLARVEYRQTSVTCPNLDVTRPGYPGTPSYRLSGSDAISIFVVTRSHRPGMVNLLHHEHPLSAHLRRPKYQHISSADHLQADTGHVQLQLASLPTSNDPSLSRLVSRHTAY